MCRVINLVVRVATHVVIAVLDMTPGALPIVAVELHENSNVVPWVLP